MKLIITIFALMCSVSILLSQICNELPSSRVSVDEWQSMKVDFYR